MSTDKTYTVKVIDSLDKMREISGIWNDLLMQSSSNTIFLTWEWLYSWAECFLEEKRKLFILTIHKNEELVGIAPWYIHMINLKISTLRQIEFLGSPEAGSDYLDVFTKKGKEKDVALCIYAFLLEEIPSRWDCLALKEIPSNSLFLLYFYNKIEEDGKYAEVNPGSFCPFVSLPKTEEEFFSSLSTHRRKRYKRDFRLLQNGNKIRHDCFLKEGIQHVLHEFLPFMKDMKGYENEKVILFIKNVTLRCKENNWVQIDILKSNGKIIASFFQFRYQDTLSLYIMATDKAFNPKISIGNVLVGLCIEKAIREGISTIDFLKGAEDYKFYWTNNGRSSLKFRFFQKRFSPVVLATVRFIKNTAKIILR